MPTGYTARIENGDITTGKEFLKLCTRAFGIAMDIRDESLSVPTSTKFEPDEYYKSRLVKAIDELEKYKTITFEEAKTEMRERHNDRVNGYRQHVEKCIENNNKYANVRAEVEAWNPPTEKHYGLKSFALEQIDACIETEEHINKYISWANEELDDSDEAVEKYIKDNIEFCIADVHRSQERWDEEIRSADSKNKWMDQFLASL